MATKVRRFIRPDFSDYVVHFSKDAAPYSHKSETIEELRGIANQTAKDRLINILSSGVLYSTRMNWTNRPAVCFTECTWASLLDHASRYSKYGLGFSKSYLFSHDGGPAVYLPPGLLAHQEKHVGKSLPPFAPDLWSFVTPFCPPYATSAYKNRFWKNKKTIDYTHEREWRVPHDLSFNIKDVAFVIVATYEDMASAPKHLKDGVGRKNWIIMENYEKIEDLWPVHHIPKSE
jgi:hypothetical protein